MGSVYQRAFRLASELRTALEQHSAPFSHSIPDTQVQLFGACVQPLSEELDEDAGDFCLEALICWDNDQSAYFL
jgi:hypothetical protein